MSCPPGRTRTTCALVGAALVGLLAGCGSAAPASDGTEITGAVVVLAASSLAGSFAELADRFEAAQPGVRVILSTGASSTLAQQVVAGAPADVFAAASPATMRTVTDAGEVAGVARVFARNQLQIAVPAGNPGEVTGLADFARDELALAVCAAQVPCGQAAGRAFAAAGISPRPDTLEQDVKAVLAKVRLGEVDAGLVYRTDVLAAGQAVEGIAFPAAEQAVSHYPVAVLAQAPQPAAARAFVALLLSAKGQSVLRAAGFLPP